MPNILNPKQLSMLMEWEGELRFLQNFKIVRYSRKHLEGLVQRTKSDDKVANKETAEAENIEMDEN